MKRFCILLVSFMCLFLVGCSGAGFEKRATLMPDRIGVSIGEQKLLPYDMAWRGVIVNFQWDFK